jgi:actin-related protein 6
VGWADGGAPTVVAPNATAHQRGVLDAFVADQILKIKNQGTLEFTRPCERGIVTNWSLQTDIWERLIPLAMDTELPSSMPSSTTAPCRTGGTTFRDTSLVATVAPFTPRQLLGYMDEIAFEHFGFASLSRLPAPCAAAALFTRNHKEHSGETIPSLSSSMSPCSSNPASSPPPSPPPAAVTPLACCVVDLGFSATYVMPTLRGKCIQGAVRRLDVGGKLLTNYLKEVVSYRQYNMMDETAIVNDAKEKLCYVAPQTLETELTRAVGAKISAKHAAYREWVLPDYRNHNRAYARALNVDPDLGRFKRTRRGGGGIKESGDFQILRMEAERFSVPEVLFAPSDVGLEQPGLPELIVEACMACDPALRPLLFASIVLVGGGARLPGLLGRLHRDLRPLVPRYCALGLSVGDAPGAAAAAAAAPAAMNTPQPSSWGDIRCSGPEYCAWAGAALLVEAEASRGGSPERDDGGPSKSKKCGDLRRSWDLPTVTKAQYDEHGASYCHERLSKW